MALWGWQRQRGSSLALRVVLLVVTTSTILAIIASAIQLTFSYRRDVAETNAVFTTFENSFQSTLSAAIWTFNTPQVELILDGILANRNVAALQLKTANGQVWERQADPALPIAERRTLPLNFRPPNQPDESLGSIEISTTTKFVRDQLLRDFVVLLLTNMLKTTIAAILFLIIINYLVSRHLRQVSRFVSRSDWLRDTAPLKLKRNAHPWADDLDHVVIAINEARADVASKYADLAKSNARLDQLNEELKEVLHVVSHDLKSPLITIEGFLGIAKAKIDKGDHDGLGDLLARVTGSARTLSRLVEDIFQISQIGAAPLTISEVRLGDVMGEVHALLDTLYDNTEVLVVEDTPNATFKADRDKLIQALMNMVSNAVRHGAPDPGMLVHVGAKRTATGTDVYVRDSGPGIPPEKLERIFDLFTQLDPKSGGTGVGLAIVDSVATKHGGRAFAESDLGEGTTIWLSLPNQELAD